MFAVGPDALPQRREKLSVGVIADPCFLVRRDVGGIDHPKRHVEREPAGEGRAAGGGVTSQTVRGVDEILAALRQFGAGYLFGNASDTGVLVIRERHGRAARERHGVAAKIQPAAKTKRDGDDDRRGDADNRVHCQAGLAAAFLIAWRTRM